MEKLATHFQKLKSALKTLKIALTYLHELTESDKYYETFRDSAIQRFEYSIDLFWKTLRDFLEKNHGLMVPASPKATLKYCADTQLISQQEYLLCVKMIEDRNLTSHAYNVNVAKAISENIHAYYTLMNTISIRLEETNISQS